MWYKKHGTICREEEGIRNIMINGNKIISLFRILAVIILAGFIMQVSAAPTVRIKDVARLLGVRDNQLVGYGIVVGLQGTGDSSKSRFTVLSVISMLERLGIKLDQKDIDPKNIAAVVVTSTLPPFASSGQKLDITISAIGDAENLEGGVLLQTPLLGADGKVYAAAQGLISIGGGVSAVGGAAGTGASRSMHKTTARVANGALIENEVRSDIVDADGNLTWVLKKPDFNTALQLAQSINKAFNPPLARALDAERIKVLLPQTYQSNPVAFIAKVEDLLMQPDAVAKVVINERTGTIVFGENTRISTVAVSHGALSVTIKGEMAPNALPGAGPAAATVTIEESKENTLTLQEGANLRDLVRALNSIGATPKDIIAVIQAIAQAGALHAEIEFI